MFGWDFNRRADRIKLFCFLFVIFSLIAYGVMEMNHYLRRGESIQQSEAKAPKSAPSPAGEASTTLNKPKAALPPPILSMPQEGSEETAVQFTKAYYAYDPKHPLQYVENSKAYMLDPLYHREKESVRRQTLDRQTTVPVSVKAYPVQQGDADVSVWEVFVKGKAIDAKGKTHPDEMSYMVTLVFVEEDQAWKVKKVLSDAGGVD